MNNYGAFPSRLEAAVFEILRLRVIAGELDMLTRYDKVKFPEAMTSWTIDFWAIDTKTDKPVWIEAKGMRCSKWVHFEKCWQKYGPGPLILYQGDYRSPVERAPIYPEVK